MGSKRDVDFGKKAAGYDDGFEGRASQRFYNLLLREMEPPHEARVLDVGCGTGAFLAKLADRSDIIGHGIDTEENMIKVAEGKGLPMSFQVARCDDIPFGDGSMDIMVACMSYHHFENRDGFAKEAARVLRSGGVLYIADPRFPWPLRKTINGILRIFRSVGRFYKAEEIASNFSGHGFTMTGKAFKGIAQVVKLRKGPDAKE